MLLRIPHYTLTSALGAGREAHLRALEAGRSGLTLHSGDPLFDRCGINCYVGEVSGLDRALPESLQDFECRNNRLAWLGLNQDGFLEAALALEAQYGADRVGVFMGTSTAGIHSAEVAYQEWTQQGGNAPALPAFDYQRTQNLFSIADFVKASLGLQGHSLTISTACSSSAKVFAAAYRCLRLGLCDAAIVGGVDSLCLTTLYGFNSLQLVSTEPCRPADAQRRGISIGEAAGFAIVLPPHANVSGNTLPYALLGYGESGDAHHMSSPDPTGDGAARAMRSALARAGCQPSEVGYINLHGTGTIANDAAEDKAVTSVFGNSTPCSSTKGFTGHTLGAAGIIEAGVSMLCIEHDLVPGSLNTREVDPHFSSNVQLTNRRQPVRVVMSNSFGFGGSNCSLLLGRAERSETQLSW